MRYTKTFIFCFILQVVSDVAVCQELTPGQSVPPLSVQGVINEPNGRLHTAGWQGKGVLLVFWNLQCKATLRAIADLSGHQRRYEKDIQIVLVNGESAAATRRLLVQRYGNVPPHLLFVTGDTVLKKLFPHFLVSHNVWIDRAGVVRHITGAQYITESNLGTFAKGGQLRLPVKRDISLREELPMLAASATEMGEVYFYSALFPGIENASSGVSYRRIGGSTMDNRIMVNNYTLKELLALAFSERGRYEYEAAGRVVLEDGLDTSWMSRNYFAFELQVPPAAAADFYPLMQQHILGALGIAVQKRQRTVPCLVLRRKEGKAAPVVAGLPSGSDIKEMGGKKIWYFRSTPAAEFVANLKMVLLAWNEQAPLVDASMFTGLVDADLDARLFEGYKFALLQQELAKGGWELRRENHVTDALVVRRAGIAAGQY